MKKSFVYNTHQYLDQGASVYCTFSFRNDRNDDLEIRKIGVNATTSDLRQLKAELLTLSLSSFVSEHPGGDEQVDVDMMFSALTHFIESEESFPLDDRLVFKPTMVNLSDIKNEENLRNKYTVAVTFRSMTS